MGRKKFVVAPSHENSDFILFFKKRKHAAEVEMKKLMKAISHRALALKLYKHERKYSKVS